MLWYYLKFENLKTYATFGKEDFGLTRDGFEKNIDLRLITIRSTVGRTHFQLNGCSAGRTSDRSGIKSIEQLVFPKFGKCNTFQIEIEHLCVYAECADFSKSYPVH